MRQFRLAVLYIIGTAAEAVSPALKPLVPSRP
jgi:hypothetical protein